MSGYYPPGSELLYSFYGRATVSTPTVSPGSAITGAYPPVEIPANYFKNTGQLSSSLKMEIGGLATATATVPTWQFFLYAVVATTTAPAFATTNTLGSTATFTPTAETNYWWHGFINIGLQTLATGAASTIVAAGKFESDMFASSTFGVTTQNLVTMPGPGAYSPFAAYDTTQAYILWPALSLGAATAGNTVTVEYCKLYGEDLPRTRAMAADNPERLIGLTEAWARGELAACLRPPEAGADDR